MTLSITTSPCHMTTNLDPGSRPISFRIDSGMTTCPRDDIFVVAKSCSMAISHINLINKILPGAASRIKLGFPRQLTIRLTILRGRRRYHRAVRGWLV